MLRRNLHEYTLEDLSRFCDDRASESRSLEFKRLLPDRSDKGKAEFLKDVTALANADGGYIFYGIDEENGAASTILPITDEATDPTVRRLGQILDAGVEPRLSGVQFHAVDTGSGYVLGIQVARSFAGPHRYNLNGSTRFVIRENAYVTDMTYDQIRIAFEQRSSLLARATEVRNSAVEKVKTQSTWRILAGGPICVVQLLPIAALTSPQNIDIEAIRANSGTLMMEEWMGYSTTYNLDGLVVYSGADQNPTHSYTQVYRSGLIEAYRQLSHHSFENVIPSVTASSFIRSTIAKFRKTLRDQGVSGPAVILVSLLDVLNYKLGVSQNRYLREQPVSDRNDLIIPEVLIDLASDQKLDEVVRPVLDILWQSFSLPYCFCYNAEGSWEPND